MLDRRVAQPEQLLPLERPGLWPTAQLAASDRAQAGRLCCSTPPAYPLELLNKEVQFLAWP